MGELAIITVFMIPGLSFGIVYEKGNYPIVRFNLGICGIRWEMKPKTSANEWFEFISW